MITEKTIERAMVFVEKYRSEFEDTQMGFDAWDALLEDGYDLNIWSDDDMVYATLYEILPDGSVDYQTFTQIYEEKLNLTK